MSWLQQQIAGRGQAVHPADALRSDPYTPPPPPAPPAPAGYPAQQQAPGLVVQGPYLGTDPWGRPVHAPAPQTAPPLPQQGFTMPSGTQASPAGFVQTPAGPMPAGLSAMTYVDRETGETVMHVADPSKFKGAATVQHCPGCGLETYATAMADDRGGFHGKQSMMLRMPDGSLMAPRQRCSACGYGGLNEEMAVITNEGVQTKKTRYSSSAYTPVLTAEAAGRSAIKITPSNLRG